MITENDVSAVNQFSFAAHASDLQIAPGVAFPTRIPTNLGNGLDFISHYGNDNFAVYEQEFGRITLTVFND